ncbi:MAG: CBS domain-containing protein [Acidimicrobiales bacterium]|nr:CBS domain-containing protein [Acidimicrobiales bacterium]
MTNQPETFAFDGADAPVSVFLAPDVVRVDPEVPLRDLADKLVAAEVGALVVGRGDAIDGIVSERDVVRAFSQQGDDTSVTAADLASRKLIWCAPDATVGDVAATMMEHYVRHVLIGDPGDLRGIVSARDLLGALLS